MPIVTQFICDRCGMVKGQSNHWFIRPDTVHSNEDFCIREAFYVRELDCTDTGVGSRILCGDSCVTADLAEFLGAMAKGK